jgi:hypothetical protein
MNKKAIAILGAIFILIVGTLGFLIYAKYSSKKTAVITTPIPGSSFASSTTAGGNSNANPPAGSNGGLSSTTPVTQGSPNVVKLSDDQVVSPVLFFSGQGVSYFDGSGNLFQANLQDANGKLQFANKKQLSIPAKPGITNVLWPAKGKDFIAQYTDPTGKLAWTYFNGTNQTYTDYPPQVESVDWLPNGAQILYVWLENGKSTLNISDPDTKNWKYLADVWENDDEIKISPDGSQFLYYETNSAANTNSINSATADGKIWKSLVKSGQNLGVLWSPDGQKFLFGKKDLNSQSYQLWIYNLTSGEVKNLGFFTTTLKAVWASDSNVIYAAVPNSANPGTSLTNDGFFRMDTNTLEKKQFNTGAGSTIDGRNLFLSTDGSKLFFRNAQDGGLYYLDLKK